jgi:prepilin-type N-terminal cleavage/methylation domain-containing protein/prepilin-type processing-associated H-X9-DG protein
LFRSKGALLNRSGFTLIEALVVVVILGILAAILFPSFSRTHHGSYERRDACRSNLIPLALSFKQYIQDYDEKYPVAQNSRTLTRPHNWAGALYPYLKSAEYFRCPSDEKAKLGQSNYGYNAWLGSRPEKNIKLPAQVIVNYEVQADSYGWTQTGTSPQNVSAATRHLDGANYSFVDGHLKWLTPEKVTALPPSKSKFTFVPG